jgi:hypothetical protein
MGLLDSLGSEAYGIVPIGSTYPTMSPIGQVGAMGRPAPGLFHPDNPMVAFGVILALTLAGFFAASYTGGIRVGPFKVSGAASAGKK